MLEIQDSRISYEEGLYKAKCEGCNRERTSKYKASLRRLLANGCCRECRVPYNKSGCKQNEDGKWLSSCPRCGAEQAYTRPDHARSSERQGWLCRSCSSSNKNAPVGAEKRLYNKFRKSANNRGISWGITFHDFISAYTGRCALTGWELSMEYGKCTASLDRIDSGQGYTNSNIQWVHSMVNMCKNKYPQDKFIEMCRAVADKVKW